MQFNTKNMIFSISQKHPCPTCDGKGMVSVGGGNISPCPTCGGEKWIMV